MDNFRQRSDGTMRFTNSGDLVDDQILGGPKAASVSKPRYYAKRIMKVPLAAVDTAGGLLSWQNPFAYDILVDRLILDVTTPATAACTGSFGQTATNGTTSSANLVDTLDIHTAAGTFDNVTDKGTNGKSRVKIASKTWLTGSVATGASAGLVGNAYLEWFPV